MKIDRVIETVRRHKLDEMMTMGAGAIAGSVEAGDDPPVRKKKEKTTCPWQRNNARSKEALEHW